MKQRKGLITFTVSVNSPRLYIFLLKLSKRGIKLILLFHKVMFWRYKNEKITGKKFKRILGSFIPPTDSIFKRHYPAKCVKLK
jgi:hypothetical protein